MLHSARDKLGALARNTKAEGTASGATETDQLKAALDTEGHFAMRDALGQRFQRDMQRDPVMQKTGQQQK